MKLYICETDIYTTVHNTRAKAVATLKKWNSLPYVNTKADQRIRSSRGVSGYTTRTIKDSIKAITIIDGERIVFDDGVNWRYGRQHGSNGFSSLHISKERHGN